MVTHRQCMSRQRLQAAPPRPSAVNVRDWPRRRTNRSTPPSVPGPSSASRSHQQLQTLNAQPGWAALFGAWERLWTVPIQIAFSMIVLQVYARSLAGIPLPLWLQPAYFVVGIIISGIALHLWSSWRRRSARYAA